MTVVNQPGKVGGQSGGELYLEIHPSQEDADTLETESAPCSTLAVDADALVLKAAGADAPRLAWYTIPLAVNRRDGIAVQVTQPVPLLRPIQPPSSAGNAFRKNVDLY